MTFITNIFDTTSTTLARSAGLMIAFSLILLAGCDTTDPHSDEEDEHAEPVGFALQIEGETLVRVPSNKKTAEWNPDGTLDKWFRDGITGLVLSPNVVSLSDADPTGLTHEIALRWIDDHGDLFDLDDPNDEFEIVWEWNKRNTLDDTCSESGRTDSDSLDQIRPANLLSVEDDHGDDELEHEEVKVLFRADHAGSDEVRFLILHGDDGHPDFTSDWVPVTAIDEDHPRIDENGVYQHTSDRCATH